MKSSEDVWSLMFPRSKCGWIMKRAKWVWMMFRWFVFRMMCPAAHCERFIPQQTVIVSHSRISFWNVMRFYLTLLHVSFWHRVQWNQLSEVFVLTGPVSLQAVHSLTKQIIDIKNRKWKKNSHDSQCICGKEDWFCYNKHWYGVQLNMWCGSPFPSLIASFYFTILMFFGTILTLFSIILRKRHNYKM